MKFSEQWLRQWVNPSLSTEELIEQLTMAGLEVDGCEPVAADFEKVVVGEVLRVTAHPEADKLRVCEVLAGSASSESGSEAGGDSGGESETLQIVCGAPNVKAGMKAPLALVGGRLGEVKIKKAKLRGQTSHGMLCSEQELGLGDNHDGLMVLPEDAPTGMDIRAYLDLDDQSIDLDLTPNRSDCLGMLGLAREAAVLNDLEIDPARLEAVNRIVPASSKADFPVVLEADDACPRYVGRVITNINPHAHSPLWMKERLRRAGLRSIDPVVDVTNYVLLELGQPLHAFDLDKLKGGIVVRLSRAGEKIHLLDDSEVTLNAGTLLITDDTGPIAMAGIMGGLESAVTDGTRNLFLESAYFSPLAIAGQARAYGMATDAAHRFERGVDWQSQSRAIERATALLLEIVGGEAGPVTETVAAHQLPTQNAVKLRAGRIRQLLGIEVTPDAVEGILHRLGFAFEAGEQAADGDVDGGATWTVVAPSHRFDIALEEDLIEEICRVYGYNNVPVRVPVAALSMAAAPEATLGLSQIRQRLVARGYQEAITYSFVDAGDQKRLEPEQEALPLQNPLSADMSVMRTSLWTGLLKALTYNLNRQQDRIRLFETGLSFRWQPDQTDLSLDQVAQQKMLAGVVSGPVHAESWGDERRAVDFFDVKGDLQALFALTGRGDDFSFSAGSHSALHPGQCARIELDGELVGHLGLIHPQVQKSLGLGQAVYLFELRVDALTGARLPTFEPLSRFPEVRRDLAVIVDQSVRFSDIRQCLLSTPVNYLSNLKLFDLYRGKGIDPTRKSLALGLTFRHSSRTLTDAEINEAVDQLVDSLKKQFHATIRD